MIDLAVLIKNRLLAKGPGKTPSTPTPAAKKSGGIVDEIAKATDSKPAEPKPTPKSVEPTPAPKKPEPAPTTSAGKGRVRYTIQRGDRVWWMMQFYGISESQFLALTDESGRTNSERIGGDANRIFPGQEVVLPDSPSIPADGFTGRAPALPIPGE